MVSPAYMYVYVSETERLIPDAAGAPLLSTGNRFYSSVHLNFFFRFFLFSSSSSVCEIVLRMQEIHVDLPWDNSMRNGRVFWLRGCCCCGCCCCASRTVGVQMCTTQWHMSLSFQERCMTIKRFILCDKTVVTGLIYMAKTQNISIHVTFTTLRGSWNFSSITGSSQ